MSALLPVGGQDDSASEYLARVASRSTLGTKSKAYLEARRHLSHLAADLAGTPRPAPRWPAGLPRLPINLSRVPWSRIDVAIASELRQRIHRHVAAGPRRTFRERAPGDTARRPVRVLPVGVGAAKARTHHLRGVLRAAFEAGRLPAARYVEICAALRGA